MSGYVPPSTLPWWRRLGSSNFSTEDCIEETKKSFPHLVILEEVATYDVTSLSFVTFLDQEGVESPWTLLFYHPQIRSYTLPADVYLFFEDVNDAMRIRLILS